MTLIDIFIRRRISLMKKYLQLFFLLQCREKALIPKFIKIKTPLRSDLGTDRIYKVAEYKLLKYFIRKKRKDIAHLEYETYYRYHELSSTLEKSCFDQVNKTLFEKIEREKKITERKLNNKIKLLLERDCKQFLRTPPNNDKFINLSSYNPTKQERYFLNSGPKFCPPQRINYDELITDIETCISKVPVPEQPALRGYCAWEVAKAKRKEMASKVIQPSYRTTLNGLKKNQEINILCADKSSNFVILDKEQFEEKALETIDKLNVKELKYEPTGNLKKKLVTLKNKYPNEAKFFDGYPIYTKTPPIFFKAKIHKPGIPLRPIVNRSFSPVVNLEKYVNKLIKPLVDNHPFSAKSSLEFLDKLKELKLNKTSKFYSFDVVSLYPSVPVNDVIMLILEKCKNHPTLKDKYDFIKDSFDLIFESNCFRFGSKLFKQLSGVGMGSCLGATFGEITMQHVENVTFSKSVLKPLFYIRYVDDCFLVWDYSDQSLTNLNDTMNNIFPTIKLTMEKEKDRTLPFLDVNIHRTENNSRLWTNVFYKTSAPLNITPASSYTHQRYLINAITPLYRRAFTHTTFTELEKAEFNKITREGINKGYNIRLIHRIKSNALKNRSEDRENQNSERKEIKYIGAIQYHRALFPILNIFRKIGFSIGFRSFKLKDLIVKDRDFPHEKGGVYEIPILCNSQKVVKYIGKTRLDLKTRKSQHINSLQNSSSYTALKQFLFDNPSAVPNWGNAKILKSPRTDKKLDIMEKVLIWRNKEDAINISNSTDIMNLWSPCFGENYGE